MQTNDVSCVWLLPCQSSLVLIPPLYWLYPLEILHKRWTSIWCTSTSCRERSTTIMLESHIAKSAQRSTNTGTHASRTSSSKMVSHSSTMLLPNVSVQNSIRVHLVWHWHCCVTLKSWRCRGPEALPSQTSSPVVPKINHFSGTKCEEIVLKINW